MLRDEKYNSSVDGDSFARKSTGSSVVRENSQMAKTFVAWLSLHASPA